MSAAATTTTTTTSIRHQLSWQFGVSKKTTHTHTSELTLCAFACEHRQWARPGGHPKAQQAAAARGIKQ